MRIWRDIGPELSLEFYLVAWIVVLVFTYMQTS